jgi:hypothetical protein
MKTYPALYPGNEGRAHYRFSARLIIEGGFSQVNLVLCGDQDILYTRSLLGMLPT